MAPLQTSLPEGAKERRVEFTSSRGEALVGLLVDTGSPAVVILCHGYMANKNMCRFPALAAALSSAGLSVFRFDHACCWRGESQRLGPFLMGNHEDEMRDMQAAAAAMRRRGKEVACLVGHSKGGINVLRYGAVVGDIPKVVWLAGRFRVREGTLQRFGADILERLAAEKSIPRREADGFEWSMMEDDFLNRVNADTQGYARTIKEQGRVQLLCVHGRGDQTIPYQESEECAAASGAQLVLVDGDHNWNRVEDARQMIAAVVQFAVA